MKRRLRILTICVLMFGATISSSNAFAWGLAFHAYLAERLATKSAAELHKDVIYGAMLPDAFNLRFDSKATVMRTLTHEVPKLYAEMVSSCATRSSAYGFASHNDEWGADFVAHHSSHVYPGHGWVEVKSEQIAPQVGAAVLNALIKSGVPKAIAKSIVAAVADDFSHYLIEMAVDLQLRRTLAPKIGEKILTAATTRSSRVRTALTLAYAVPLVHGAGISLARARLYLTGAEKTYQEQLKLFGTILSLDPLQLNKAVIRNSANVAKQRLQRELNARGMGTKTIITQLGLVSDLIDFATRAVGNEWQAEIEPTLRDLAKELRKRGFAPCLPTARR